jgi:hypothetical protein
LIRHSEPEERDLKSQANSSPVGRSVKARVLLCILKWYVEWPLRKQLAPVLCDHADPVARRAKTEFVVALAQVGRS